MRVLAIILACLACAGNGRRVLGTTQGPANYGGLSQQMGAPKPGRSPTPRASLQALLLDMTRLRGGFYERRQERPVQDAFLRNSVRQRALRYMYGGDYDYGYDVGLGLGSGYGYGGLFRGGYGGYGYGGYGGGYGGYGNWLFRGGGYGGYGGFGGYPYGYGYGGGYGGYGNWLFRGGYGGYGPWGYGGYGGWWW